MYDLIPTLVASTGIWQAAAPIPIDMGTVDSITPVKVPIINTVTLAKGVGANLNTSLGRVEILIDGVYKLASRGTFEFQLSGELLLQFWRNGTPMGFPVPIQGRGAGKSVMASNGAAMELLAGDYLEGFALAETGSFNLTLTSGTISIERTLFT